MFLCHSIENTYSTNSITNHISEDIKSLANIKNTKGFFLNYNGILDIELAESIRTNRLYIKPFTNESSFSPTNGSTYASVYASFDGDNYEYLGKLPSTYGSTYYNNYLTDLCLQQFYTFKFLRFQTDNSSYFSISYLGFTK